VTFVGTSGETKQAQPRDYDSGAAQDAVRVLPTTAETFLLDTGMIPPSAPPPPPRSTSLYNDFDEDDVPSSAAEMYGASHAAAAAAAASAEPSDDPYAGLQDDIYDSNGPEGEDEYEEPPPPPPPPPPPEPPRYDGDEVVGAIRRAALASLPRQSAPRTLRYQSEYPHWRQEVRRFGEMPGLLNALRAALDDAVVGRCRLTLADPS